MLRGEASATKSKSGSSATSKVVADKKDIIEEHGVDRPLPNIASVSSVVIAARKGRNSEAVPRRRSINSPRITVQQCVRCFAVDERIAVPGRGSALAGSVDLTTDWTRLFRRVSLFRNGTGEFPRCTVTDPENQRAEVDTLSWKIPTILV
jgi:hypothetical protein